MAKLNLKDVTLVSVNSIYPEDSIRAMRVCMTHCDFGNIKIFSNQHIKVDGIHSVVRPIKGLKDYCYFIMKELNDHIDTSHVLIVQPDGFIINPKAWTNEFLKYDYIGAPWRLNAGIENVDKNNRVGNGGFSLRSKKLLEATQNRYEEDEFFPEDELICRTYRKFFVTKCGIDFAPYDIAVKFAVDSEKYDGSFGFHGKLTMAINNIELYSGQTNFEWFARYNYDPEWIQYLYIKPRDPDFIKRMIKDYKRTDVVAKYLGICTDTVERWCGVRKQNSKTKAKR